MQKLKGRKAALRKSPYGTEKENRLLDVMNLEYKLHKERENRRIEKLVITKFDWRSKELKCEFRSLDTKVNTAMSERGKRNGELSSLSTGFSAGS